MKTRVRIALTIVAALVGTLLADVGFHLMNIPRDVPFFGGVLILIALFIVVPAVLSKVWGSKPEDYLGDISQENCEEHHEETHTA